MDDAEVTLLLTRPAPQSAAFLSMCERAANRRIPVVVSPLIEIVETEDLPDISHYSSLIFSSRNAVRRFAGTNLLQDKVVYTVGEATAALAREAGANATALGTDVSEFMTRHEEIAGPCLHLRGTHARGDIATNLTGTGVRCDEVIIYDQAARPLSTAGLQLLTGEAPVIAPLFSPRTAKLLAESVTPTAPLTVIAMSDTVADAWTGPGEIVVAVEPTVEAMCFLTVGAV